MSAVLSPEHSEPTAAPRSLWRLAMIVLVALAARSPFFSWPLTGDEGNYAYTADWWSRGATLYADYLGMEKPQGVFVSYLASQWLLGADAWGIRLWGALWAAATAVVLYFVAGRMSGARAALPAAILYATFSSAPQIDGFQTNSELFLVLPLSASVLALLHRRSLLAGLLVGASLTFKVSAVVGLAVVVYWLLRERSASRDWTRMAAGLVIAPLVGLVHGIATVGLPSYLYSVYLFRSEVGWAYIPEPVAAMAVGWARTAPVWLPLSALALIAWKRNALCTNWIGPAWLVTSLFGVAMGGEWTGHYFMQLLPPLAVMAGTGIAAFAKPQPPLVPGLTVALLVLSVARIAPLYWAAPYVGAWETYHRPGIQVSASVADYVRAHTDEDDAIYVAFYQANIYHEAKRRAAVPFLSRVQLLFIPGAYDRTVRAIADQMPAYVVDLGQPLDQAHDVARFYEALERGYRVETMIGEARLYVRR